jgi:hypothetical protein
MLKTGDNAQNPSMSVIEILSIRALRFINSCDRVPTRDRAGRR